ncbi:MAG: hypothetical protein WDN49_07950 [Acetobacteraceae bacterium]
MRFLITVLAALAGAAVVQAQPVRITQPVAAAQDAPGQPVLDVAAVPFLAADGRAAYAGWLLTNLPRAGGDRRQRQDRLGRRPPDAR